MIGCNSLSFLYPNKESCMENKDNIGRGKTVPTQYYNPLDFILDTLAKEILNKDKEYVDEKEKEGMVGV